MNTFQRWAMACQTLERIRNERIRNSSAWKASYIVRLEAAIEDEAKWREKVERLVAERELRATNRKIP